MNLEWRRGKLFEKNAVIAIFEEIKQEKYATVIEVSEKERIIEKPLALNTVTLLRKSSELLGINATETMKILNSLYNNGYITYYKTYSTSYGKDFDYDKVLSTHQLHSEWGKYVLKLIDNGYNAPTKGEEVGDNLPIIPIKSAEKGTLNNNEWKIYSYITKIFLATMSKPVHYTEKEITFQIDQELFKLNAKQIQEKGFYQIVPWLNNIVETDIKKFETGQEYFIDTKKIIDGKTDLPTYMTEFELITAMKNHEMGGHFKIPHYIKSLIDNGYVTIDKKNNRAMMPTSLGTGLIKAYKSSGLDPELALPKTRAIIEKACEKIAFNELDSVKVVNHILRSFKSKYEYFNEHFDEFETVFRSEVIEKSEEYAKLKKEEKKAQKKQENIAEPQQEDLKSYEHCTVYEEHKEKLKKRPPELLCRLCENGILKQAPDRIGKPGFKFTLNASFNYQCAT